ncbi:hypothetical protein BD779DRAFT_51338 [Infundibulicybe gibba]|nr:hypothetical protein BD779DRAFT_51338 [Infundibulicybe gibba]
MVDDKSLSIPSASVGKLSGSNPDLPQSALSRFSGHIPQLPPRREPKLRRAQTSLPPIGRSSSGAQGRLQWEADEEKLNREYEAKTALLNESLIQNQRIRQLLNRISADVRDYETVQSEAMKSFHTPYDSLPRELLEAFSHDPAAVTGATRRGTGYMVVDDIHNRLVRQREIFQEFLKQVGKSEHGFKGVLGDPIVALVQCLRELEAQRESVCKKAQNVGAKLATVQGVHSLTKDEYNMALSHVSVVYPELSHIIALEESYKDQYQQFWEFGMDALTFLLDTITPFWRTYGKTIGEDTRDFLIIPLYRNEFTGEAKRYHIQHFPKRSFRHWLGLILFFLSSVTVMVLQGRAAVSSSSHYKLRWITYESVRWTAIPFFWVGILIQWWAVLTEFAIVFLQLGVIVWWVGWSVRLFN